MNTSQQIAYLSSPHPLRLAMTYTQEKLFFGVATLISSGVGWAGAILSQGDVRWLSVTFAVSFMTSSLLALVFRKPDETFQLTGARCGLTILGGVFVTKLVAHYFNLSTVHTDPINLGGVTFAVSIGMFFLGYSSLRYLERRSDFLVGKFIDLKVRAAMEESKHIPPTE